MEAVSISQLRVWSELTHLGGASPLPRAPGQCQSPLTLLFLSPRLTIALSSRSLSMQGATSEGCAHAVGRCLGPPNLLPDPQRCSSHQSFASQSWFPAGDLGQPAPGPGVKTVEVLRLWPPCISKTIPLEGATKFGSKNSRLTHVKSNRWATGFSVSLFPYLAPLPNRTLPGEAREPKGGASALLPASSRATPPPCPLLNHPRIPGQRTVVGGHATCPPTFPSQTAC